MESMTNLEASVLSKLLSGDHPALTALREQAQRASVRKRKLTGVGFFTTLSVSAEAPRAALSQKRVCLGDVVADIEGLQHGAGFVLFVENGFLSTLEGYTYDEPWPDTLGQFTLRYTSTGGRDRSSLLK
jgi:hypothetical protein